MGWSTGTFGLYGLDKNDIKTPAFNFIGIVIVVVGMYIFLQVKTNDMHRVGGDDAFQPILEHDEIDPEDSSASAHRVSRTVSGSFSGTHQQFVESSSAVEEEDHAHFGSSWSHAKKRVVGLTMAVMAGVMFGVSFVPAQFVIDNHYDGDDSSLNYVFPHFCGIWIASWSYMILYATYKYMNGEVLYVNHLSILPAAMAGAMWGIACIAWFVANGKLGFSISFPLITSGPGFVGSMYGIFLFDEISGKKNFVILGVAFTITLVGLIFISASH